jgi:predicted amidohydrolase
MTYSVEFYADVEMVGDDPHPPALTVEVRPNFVVGDSYCLCYITETSPAEGIRLHGRGSFKATAVCAPEVRDHFASGASFELRAASRVFARGIFREIISCIEDRPLAV